MRFTAQDIGATLVSLLLAAGVIGLAAFGKPIPAELGPALGAAMTWLFVRGAQASTMNGGPNR